MPQLTRITRNPSVMGGKPCIRGMRVTVGTVVALVAAGRTRDEILRDYPTWKPRTLPRPCPMPPGGRRKSKSVWLRRVMTFPVRADAVAAGFVSSA
jgi:Protein of unknown function (DUF433)